MKNLLSYKNEVLSGESMDNMCKDCVNWSGIGFAENAGWCKKKNIPVLYDDKCDDDFEHSNKNDMN